MYLGVTFDLQSLNIFGQEKIPQLIEVITAPKTDEHVKVVVFNRQSAYSKPIYNKLDKGGHFAAWEQPELFTTEIRAALASLRCLERWNINLVHRF